MVKIPLYPNEEKADGRVTFGHKPFTLEEVEKNTAEVIEDHYQRYREGDEKAVLQLLEINRDFYWLPWVSECIAGWITSNTSNNKKMLEGLAGRKGRGRPEDRIKWSYYLMIEALIAKKGCAAEKAFAELEGKSFFGKALGFDAIKRNYYLCKKEYKSQIMLTRFPPGTLCK
jgi:hypothetical protein